MKHLVCRARFGDLVEVAAQNTEPAVLSLSCCADPETMAHAAVRRLSAGQQKFVRRLDGYGGCAFRPGKGNCLVSRGPSKRGPVPGLSRPGPSDDAHVC